MSRAALLFLACQTLIGACAERSTAAEPRNEDPRVLAQRSGLGVTTLVLSERTEQLASTLASLPPARAWIGADEIESWREAGWRLLAIDPASTRVLAGAAGRRAPIATSNHEPVAAWARLLPVGALADRQNALMARAWISPGDDGSGGLRVQVREGAPRRGAIASFDPVPGGLGGDWWLPAGARLALVHARPGEDLALPSGEAGFVVLLRAGAPERFSLGVVPATGTMR